MYQHFINVLSTFYQLFINCLSTLYQLLSTNILSTCYHLFFINFINFFESIFYQLVISCLSTFYPHVINFQAFYKSPPPRKYLIVSVAQVFSDCIGRLWHCTPSTFNAIQEFAPNTQSGSQWCCTALLRTVAQQTFWK